MNSKFLKSSFILLLSILFYSPQAHSWGEDGHHLICQLAAQNVSEKALNDFLKTRGHVMGHLCNIPDIHWRNLPKEITDVGNTTHYFDIDMLKTKAQDMPTDIEKVKKLIKKEIGESSNIAQTGSLWWRAKQLQELATRYAKEAKKSKIPKKASLEIQNNENPYNSNVYEMMLKMGFLGHFVGDVSMPYHNVTDYDGYGAGHGGIHKFYESTCVAEFNLWNLALDVQKEVDSLKNYKDKKDIVQIMKELSLSALNELEQVQSLDQITKISVKKTTDDGLNIKIPAERPAPAKICPSFRPLIVKQMARSVKALSYMWDLAYRSGGKPELSSYGSFRYPLAPDFVTPNY